MVQPRHQNPPGRTQPIQHSLLQSNSGMVTSQGSPPTSQIGFSSMTTPRTHYGSMNMLGNVPNVSSLLHQSLTNGAPNSGLSGPGNSQRELTDNGAEVDILTGGGNGMSFDPPPSSLTSNTSGQLQVQQISNMFGNQIVTNSYQSQQFAPRNFHHNQPQLSVHSTNQQQQQQFQTIRDGLGAVRQDNMELQMVNDQTSEQLQTLQTLNSVPLESQLQGMRSLPQVTMETRHGDILQQQQQPPIQLSKQNHQAAEILEQQRQNQLQHQQHNLLKSMPPQRSTLQPQFPEQNLPMRSPVRPLYEPGACARRLGQYLHRQQHRPNDNNIEFWKKFVAEFFAPNAKKRWCVSMYGTHKKIAGVLPQDVWLCEICNLKPGRGFEAPVEVLPRIFKVKYDSGTLEELLYLDMPQEYQNSSGQIVLHYAKVVQQCVFENQQVVRDCQLRLVFSSDLKICSWEFCAKRHKVVIPKNLLTPQVNQFRAAAKEYKATIRNSSSNISVCQLQNICNMFVTSAWPLVKALDVDVVNDLGYTNRYVRCLQISDVVNSMKGLMDYSRKNKIGPLESLAKFPRRSSSSPAISSQQREDQIQQPDLLSQQQQTAGQNSNSDISSQNPAKRHASDNRMMHLSTAVNTAPAGSSASDIAMLMHQNSMSSRQQNLANGSNDPCDFNGVQMPSPGSSMPQSQTNLSTFRYPSHGGMSGAGTHINSAGSPNLSIQQHAPSVEVHGYSLSSVQKIVHDYMQSSNLSRGAVNGTQQTNNYPNHNGNNGAGIDGTRFGSMANDLGQPTTVNEIQPGLANNSMSINGRAGMVMALSLNRSMNQGNQMPSGSGTTNGFNNPQFN